MRKVGKRQREVLTTMKARGGIWPPEWKIDCSVQDVFDALVWHGEIEHVDGCYRLRADR